MGFEKLEICRRGGTMGVKERKIRSSAWIVQVAAKRTAAMPCCVLHAAGYCAGNLQRE